MYVIGIYETKRRSIPENATLFLPSSLIKELAKMYNQKAEIEIVKEQDALYSLKMKPSGGFYSPDNSQKATFGATKLEMDWRNIFRSKKNDKFKGVVFKSKQLELFVKAGKYFNKIDESPRRFEQTIETLPYWDNFSYVGIGVKGFCGVVSNVSSEVEVVEPSFD